MRLALKVASALMGLILTLVMAGCSDEPDFTASIDSFEVAFSSETEPGQMNFDRISITATFTNNTSDVESPLRCSITLSKDPRFVDGDELTSRATVPPGSSVQETHEIRIEMDVNEVRHIEVDRCQESV